MYGYLTKNQGWKNLHLSRRNLSRTRLIWEDPPGQLGKERGEGGRTDIGETRQDEQTACLTLSHLTASQYWTECRSFCVLIFKEKWSFPSLRHSHPLPTRSTRLELICRQPDRQRLVRSLQDARMARTSRDPAACSELSDRATDSDPSIQIFKWNPLATLPSNAAHFANIFC